MVLNHKVGRYVHDERYVTVAGPLLAILAIVLSLPHPLIIVSALVCWLSIEVIVRKIEEPYLIRTHGEEFIAYYNNTNRYLIF